jgi:hypothetical protein
MPQTTQTPTKSSRLKDTVIVLAVALVCLVGCGGWRFIVNDEEINLLIYHSPSFGEKVMQCLDYFIFDGGLAAIIAGLVSLLILRKLKRTSPNQEL